MVEQIRISPEEVRGYGNVCEEHTLDDFTVNVSSLSKVSETVHGALTNTYKLLYSVYGLMFDFDKGAKQLYLQTNEADTLSLGFDTENKQLYLVDENDTGFSLDFDEDTNELYITDDAPPIVHNYSLALDQSSYTTTGSLSVSATLLDDGVAVEGATVSFTGGVSTVTGVTDSSGVATATVNFTSSGTLTASYSNVSDTASVTVGQATLSLATNKSILSYYDSDSATLTATYSLGAGGTVELYNSNDVKIGTFTDAGGGTYTYSLASTGAGDLSLYAKCSGVTSSNVSIEDCFLYSANETSRTSTYTTDTLIAVFSNFSFVSDSFLFEADVKYTGESIGIAVTPNNANAGYHHLLLAYNYGKQSFYIGKQNSGEDTYRYDSISANTYYSLKFTYENGTVTSYMDGTQKGQYTGKTYLNGETRNLYWYEWNSGRTITAKNIKIKLL